MAWQLGIDCHKFETLIHVVHLHHGGLTEAVQEANAALSAATMVPRANDTVILLKELVSHYMN